MPKTVLLARPHPFIAAEMRAFLEEAGFAPKKLETLEDLASDLPRASGVVISLALSSAVGESAEDVLRKIRGLSSQVPVLFASMLPLEKARVGLERLAQRSAGAPVQGIEADQSAAARLGRPETFLYLSKADLLERRAVAARLIQRHFK